MTIAAVRRFVCPSAVVPANWNPAADGGTALS